MKARAVAAVLPVCLAFGAAAHAQTIFHVKPNATGNGSSWGNAANLQFALSQANTLGDQIWVAAGTYLPGRNRSDTFTLKANVSIYGGFAGSETALEQRDPASNVTILSGEIGQAGATDNSYHVVTGQNTTGAVLDGFVVTAGYAAGSNQSGVGAALYFNHGTHVIRNCVLKGNYALFGSAVYCRNASAPTLINCIISDNQTVQSAAVYATGTAQPTLVHCTVAGNIGGGIRNDFYPNSGIDLTHCVVYHNTVGISGSGVDVSYSNIQDVLYAGTGNISEGPLFVDPANGDYHLSASVCVSPCLDAGDPAFQIIPGAELDIDGEPRILGPRTDMGADEIAVPLGDCDVPDGFVDQDDFGQFDSCVTGPGGTAGSSCACADFDTDADVDFADFGDFLLAFNPLPAIPRDFEPPTMSSPVAAPETEVVETLQPEIESENGYGVYPFSGEFHYEMVDLQIPGRRFDFIWKRRYRSRVGQTTTMGANWDHSYNIYIEPYGPHLILHDGNGRRDVYYGTCGGQSWSAPGLFREITIDPVDGHYVVSFVHLSTWKLAPLTDPDTPGRIKEIKDRNENTMSFGYDPQGRLSQITDTVGRAITIGYNTDGFIETVTDFAAEYAVEFEGQTPSGRVIRYAYYQPGEQDGSPGDLKSVTYPAVVNTPNGNNYPTGKTWTYTYSAGSVHPALDHNLLTITDGRGQVFLVNQYDPTTDPLNANFDRVVAQEVGGASYGSYTYDYSPADGTGGVVMETTVTDRAGNDEMLRYDAGNRLLYRLEYTNRDLRPEEPESYETQFTYNSDSLLIEVLYERENKIQQGFDSYAADPRSRGNRLWRWELPGPTTSEPAEICRQWAYSSPHNFVSVPLRPDLENPAL